MNNQELISIIKNQHFKDGLNDTIIPSLKVFYSSRTTQKLPVIYEPALFVILQGEKIVFIDKKAIKYDSSSYLISSTFMPISGQITEACKDKPFLSLQITFTMKQILEAVEYFIIKPQKTNDTRLAISSYTISDNLFEPVSRFVSLLKTPNDITALAPLYLKEILYRLLISHNNIELKQLAYIEGNAYKISQAISFINENLFKNISIEEIATNINMSVSSFHKHFKIITAISPLQFIKKQRLQKAKNLMLIENMDITGASYYVGYQSVSQFSREYSDYFGLNPSNDIKNFKQQLVEKS